MFSASELLLTTTSILFAVSVAARDTTAELSLSEYSVATEDDQLASAAKLGNSSTDVTGAVPARGSAFRFSLEDLHPLYTPAIGFMDTEEVTGFSVAIDGDIAVVGALSLADYYCGCGEAFVFRKMPGEWQFEAQLVGIEASNNDSFGVAVDVEGDLIAVGASGEEGNGAVHVFRRHPTEPRWRLSERLQASDGATGDRFGRSVAIDSERIFVGAPQDDYAGPSAGSLYIFERQAPDDWLETGKVTLQNSTYSGRIGEHIAAFDDQLIAGSPLSNGSQTASGVAFVFGLDPITQQWSLDQEFSPQSLDGWARFGSSVAVQGNIAVIGAERHQIPGAAFIFTRETPQASWQLHQTINQSVPVTGDDEFGSSVAIDGDLIAVGASRLFINGEGAVFAFRLDHDTGLWGEEAVLTIGNGQGSSEFGDSVDLSSGRIVAGAPFHSHYWNARGSARLFEFDGDNRDWSNSTFLDPGEGEVMDHFGSSVALTDRFLFVGEPADSFAAESGSGRGAVNVFKLDSESHQWVPSEVLYPPESTVFTYRFGQDIDADKNQIIISAHYPGDHQNGQVFVFQTDQTGANWVALPFPEPLALTADSGYGTSVAINGDWAFVGAPYYDDTGMSRGAVFVFQKEVADGEWQSVTSILPEGKDDFLFFGTAVEVQGEFLFVGAPSLNGSTVSVYQLQVDQWELIQRLTGAGVGTLDEFGASLSAFQDGLIVGAPGEYGYGAVYRFELEQGTGLWAQTGRFTSDFATLQSRFGQELAMGQDLFLVGAPDDNYPYSPGAAFLFEYSPIWNDWHHFRYAPEEQFVRRSVGSGVALHGDYFAIGAENDSTVEPNSGSVFVSPAITLFADSFEF